MTLDQIKSAALKLAPSEREALAEDLLLSISDADRAEIDAAWLDEARRRDALFAADPSRAKPADDVIKRLRARAQQS
jgi:putative addiction module component (TIGR02574 family)